MILPDVLEPGLQVLGCSCCRRLQVPRADSGTSTTGVSSTGTDERLDDLSSRMDDGFSRVDQDLRQLRIEISARFDAVDARFDALHRLIVQASGGMLIAVLATILSVLATRA
jgi:hypothetical protein